MNQCYVYKWTNINTNKWYIGGRYSNKVLPELDNYFSSSKIVKKLIKETPGEWVREILFVGSKTDTYNKETELLQRLDARNDPNSYNQHNNEGFGEVRVPGWNSGKSMSPASKEKLSAANKGKVAWNKGLPLSEETRKKIGDANRGRKQSEEAKEKNRNAQLGRIPWNKGKTLTEDQKKNLKGRTPWNKGKEHKLPPKICPECNRSFHPGCFAQHRCVES